MQASYNTKMTIRSRWGKYHSWADRIPTVSCKKYSKLRWELSHSRISHKITGNPYPLIWFRIHNKVKNSARREQRQMLFRIKYRNQYRR